MTEMRNPERDLERLRTRLAVAMLVVLVCFGLLGVRFWWLQVHRYASFRAQAENNRIALIPAPPPRGLIFDRNGVLLAENISAYTLELRASAIADLDGTIDALGRIVEISESERMRFRRLLRDARRSESVALKTRLSDEEVARLAVQSYRFPGVEIRARAFRSYPLGDTAAHLLGYVGRISKKDLEWLDDQNLLAGYAGSTHIGKTGVEQSYEQALHGLVGADEVEVSAGGRVVRTLSRTPPVPGANLVLSIDARLQKLAETLYGNRRGALVAIEPATGAVLALVSRPGFDPNVFVDGVDPQTWQGLNEDPDHPLLNRPLRGAYPPGSTYKPFMALAALTSGARSPTDTIFDPGYFQLGNHRFRDSRPGGQGTVDLRKSIVVSSDTYYYRLAYEMGVDSIHDFMKPWGFGQLTGIDLKNESAGILPSTQWKQRRFRQPWYPGDTPSIGIGQGYNAFTILQLAHATATLANDGVVMTPHVVQAVENPETHVQERIGTQAQAQIALKPAHLKLVREAMAEVNRTGTGRTAFVDAGYVAAGKTGTAQVVGIRQDEKYDASKLDERHRDHSLFIAFAPLEKPAIAIALIVENGGFGAQAAAPIVRRMFDYWLLGRIPADIDPEILSAIRPDPSWQGAAPAIDRAARLDTPTPAPAPMP